MSQQDALDFEFNSYLDHQKEMGLVTKRVFFEMSDSDQKAFFRAWKKMHFAKQEMYRLIGKYRGIIRNWH